MKRSDTNYVWAIRGFVNTIVYFDHRVAYTGIAVVCQLGTSLIIKFMLDNAHGM